MLVSCIFTGTDNFNFNFDWIRIPWNEIGKINIASFTRLRTAKAAFSLRTQFDISIEKWPVHWTHSQVCHIRDRIDQSTWVWETNISKHWLSILINHSDNLLSPPLQLICIANSVSICNQWANQLTNHQRLRDRSIESMQFYYYSHHLYLILFIKLYRRRFLKTMENL